MTVVALPQQVSANIRLSGLSLVHPSVLARPSADAGAWQM